MKRAAVDKWKRKKWIHLISSSTFKEKVLGETVTEKPEIVQGRTIKVNARNVVDETRKGFFTLKFKVEEVRNDKGLCVLVGHEIKPGYVKRIVRKGTSKIESVKEYSFKDGKKIRLKSMAVTRMKTARKQKTGVLKALEAELMAQAEQKPYEEFIKLVIEGKIQPQIEGKINKVVPIKSVDVIKSTLLS